jgi:Na+-transporting methylmalonyl-CoA/oxaloacetate decarboxylase gamma subunit
MIFAKEKYTSEELNARLKFFIGIILGLTLFGIVFVVLYSLIFVTQPMNGMSPVDNKFFELIIPIATFLTGTLSGIMLAGDDKDLRAKAIDAASKPYTPPPEPQSVARYVPTPEPITPPAPLTPVVAVAEPVVGFGGKPAPAQPLHPEI